MNPIPTDAPDGQARPDADSRRWTIALVVFAGLVMVPVVWTLAAHLPVALLCLPVAALALARARRRELVQVHENETDGETRMSTRARFLESAQKMMDEGEGNPAVLVIDLNGLRDVQTVLGDQRARAVVAELSQRVRDAADGWPVGTLGDERFCAAMMARPFLPAHHVGRAIRSAIARPMAVDGVELRLSASIGVAQGEQKPDTLLRRATMAATDAARKNTGLEMHQSEPSEVVRRRLVVAAALSQAMEDPKGRGFRAEYQPIVDPDGELQKAEALARWNDPKVGVVSPGEFVPLAEQTGLIDPMFEIMLEEAVTGCATWLRAGIDAGVTINLSAVNLRQPLLVSELTAALDRARLSPAYVTVEITETAVIEDGANAVRVLRDLRTAGFEIALDDFGVGYSSLSRLQDLPVTVVKLDQAFAGSLTTDARTAAIVRATVDVCRALDLQVVAEGIETAEQADMVSSMGVGLLQGFLFSRSLALQDLIGGEGRADTAV